MARGRRSAWLVVAALVCVCYAAGAAPRSGHHAASMQHQQMARAVAAGDPGLSGLASLLRSKPQKEGATLHLEGEKDGPTLMRERVANIDPKRAAGRRAKGGGDAVVEEPVAGGPTWAAGDRVPVECKALGGDADAAAPFERGPTCAETGSPLALVYGDDSFVYCGLEVRDASTYAALVDVVRLNRTWHCRLPMTPKRDFFVPFTIPVWGVKENDHVHVDNHLNFVLHVDAGRILAAACYPIRDRFQFVKVGTVVSFHGAVRWFSGHTFQGLEGAGGSATAAAAAPGSGECSVLVIMTFCFLTALATALGAAVLYQQRLKPRLLRRLLKER